MKGARLAHLLQLAAQLAHACPDHPPVSLDLRFAGAAEEAETAALPLQMGPAADKSALLIIEMGQFDLQSPFGRDGSLAENLEDQSRPVDNLSAKLLFEVALLDRGQGTVNDNQFCLFDFTGRSDPFDLALAEHRARADVADRQDECLGNDYPNRQRKPARFFQPALRILSAATTADIRAYDKGTRTARNLAFELIIDYQALSPSSSSKSVVKSTWVAG